MRAALAACALLALALAPAVARAGSPQALCASIGTDDTLRPLLASLVPAARKAFGYTGMSVADIEQMTVFRCMHARVFMCSWGANLPCGKADTSRVLAPASDWCKSNPDSSFIPAYVTGHDTIYQWSCRGGAAMPSDPAPLDARGFFRSYWQPAQ